MTTNTRETMEILFNDFLNSDPRGELAEAMHEYSAAIDAQIEMGSVDPDIVTDYELAAIRYGYYAGFMAALDMQTAKIRLALERLQAEVLEED